MSGASSIVRSSDAEVVAERVGPARGPEPDRGRDPDEEVVGRDEHAVLEQAELAVRVAGCGDELPAVELLALVHQDRDRAGSG